MRPLLRRIRRLVPPKHPAPVILMYHRIATPSVDPWGLSVSPDRFEEQLAVLRKWRTPMPMRELVDRLDRGTLPANAAAVTFDDGYSDTLREARPRLAAAGVPATLFLATAFVGQRRDYWWDELARSILGRAEALECEVAIGGDTCHLRLAAADEARHGSTWRAWKSPRTEREVLYMTVWRKVRALPAGDRDAAMSRLREALAAPSADERDMPMTAGEVVELAADGVFDIGGHTATHPVLPDLDPAGRRREILAGKQACERLIDRAVAGFAYPHGAHDADSRAAVEECGFRWACTTEPRAVAASGFDRYALPRIAVADWDGPAFELALQSARI